MGLIDEVKSKDQAVLDLREQLRPKRNTRAELREAEIRLAERNA